MRVTITDNVKIWEITDKNTMAEVKWSTSRKVKEGDSYDQIQIDNGVAKNGYIAEYRNFVRFVGHAYNQLKNIKEGDVITNLLADISREPYWDSRNNCIQFPKNEKITVFEFEVYDPSKHNKAVKNLDRAPQVAEEPKATPVAQTYQATAATTQATPVAPVTPVAEVAPVATAADECPF